MNGLKSKDRIKIKMKKSNVALRESGFVLLGEVIISILIVAVYLVIKQFSGGIVLYKVITGVTLGSLVTVLNFLFLSVSTNKVIDRFLLARGNAEMTEEEADAFAAKYQAELQNKAKLSYIIRTVTMLAALVVAFLVDQFAVIPTLIPLFMLRPIIMVRGLLGKRGDKTNES